MGRKMTSDPQVNNEQKKLSIQVRLDGFSFYIKNEDDKKTWDPSFSFGDLLTPEEALIKNQNPY